MLMYRSAGWMINTAAPEISMGLPTQEELHDIIDVRPDGTVSFGGVEEGSVRAPAAVEVPQPKSKSERAAEPPAIAQADADGVIEMAATQKQPEPVQQSRSTRRTAADNTQPAAGAAREPGADDESFELGARAGGEPVSDSVLKILKTKMEQAALGEADLRKRFGFGYEGVTKTNYHAAVAWIENPMGE
ncbi:hypothetical protein WS91_27575 [Burkholderia sp. MSMB1498]|nr:hypothetical protein WS91_27575 [Burkholderia sp. MSMB1498]